MPKTIEIREAWCAKCHDIVEHSVRAPARPARSGGPVADVELWTCPRSHMRLLRSRTRIDGLG